MIGTFAALLIGAQAGPGEGQVRHPHIPCWTVALGPGGPAIPAGSHAQDALSALANLGFKPAEASAAVAKAEADLGTEAKLDALVRLALKKAAR